MKKFIIRAAWPASDRAYQQGGPGLAAGVPVPAGLEGISYGWFGVRLVRNQAANAFKDDASKGVCTAQATADFQSEAVSATRFIASERFQGNEDQRSEEISGSVPLRQRPAPPTTHPRAFQGLLPLLVSGSAKAAGSGRHRPRIHPRRVVGWLRGQA